MKTLCKIFSWLLLLGFLASCASGPKMAEVKSSIPTLAADKGRIYFYRTANIFGGAMTSDIRLNAETVGRSVPGSVFYVDRSPGSYAVACATETEKKLTMVLAAGETKYVRTYASPGLLVGRVVPELVSLDEAQKEMANLAYVGTSGK
jgi:Protein of unknown function (DUF2846)